MEDKFKIRARRTLLNITPYTPGKPIWELEEEMCLTDIIKLASNENPLGPSPKALAAIEYSLLSIHRYPECAHIPHKKGSRRQTRYESGTISDQQWRRRTDYASSRNFS